MKYIATFLTFLAVSTCFTSADKPTVKSVSDKILIVKLKAGKEYTVPASSQVQSIFVSPLSGAIKVRDIYHQYGDLKGNFSFDGDTMKKGSCKLIDSNGHDEVILAQENSKVELDYWHLIIK